MGLGAALATFAVGATGADASSCNNVRRACRCTPPPAYSFLTPPPSRFIPPEPVYGYRSPRGHYRYGPSGASYDDPPPGYRPGRPWINGVSYYGATRPEFGSYPGYRSRRVRFEDYDDAPPPYDRGYRRSIGWAQNR
jgi:hypothetical protein